MKCQRILSSFLILALLVGLMPAPSPAQTTATPGYNPYLGYNSRTASGGVADPRYNQQYGQRYNPAYYQPGGTGYSGGHGFTRLIPPLVGGVLGLAMGAKFGLVGALLGAAIGGFGGYAISSSIFGNSHYQGQSSYFAASNKMNFIPGAIGAVAGAMLGSHFGIVGMLIGGGIGYLAAKTVARVMFPTAYYGSGSYGMPGGYGSGYGSGYGAGYYTPFAAGDAEVAPASTAAKASTDPAADLAELKDVLYQAMSTYKDALVDEDEATKLEAREGFLAAQRAYFGAKEALASSPE